jgi:thiamine biosynthesis protein ThiS
LRSDRNAEEWKNGSPGGTRPTDLFEIYRWGDASGGAEPKENNVMNLTVNGSPHEHTGDGTVAALLTELGANPEHSALTINGDLIFSKDWKTFTFTDGDAVEVLTFVGGG